MFFIGGNQMSAANGNEILKVFQYVQQVFRECQQLIVKLDGLMAPEWKPVYGSRITRDVTSSLNDPEHWLVEAIFRIYESNDSSVNKGITITFWGNIQEPVITIGEITYTDVSKRGHWDLWYSWFEFEDEKISIDDRKLDGSILELTPKDYDYIKRVKMFSLPLVEIQNDNDVENKIYKELMKL